MKTLLLLRHATAGSDGRVLSDHERPLTERGEQHAPRVGELLRGQEPRPDRILASTAVRALRTAEIVAGTAALECPVEPLDELYLAPPARILAVVRRHAGERRCLLVVAHNPGLEELVTQASGRLEPFPAASLARLALDIESWDELRPGCPVTLTGLWRPHET